MTDYYNAVVMSSMSSTRFYTPCKNWYLVMFFKTILIQVTKKGTPTLLGMKMLFSRLFLCSRKRHILLTKYSFCQNLCVIQLINLNKSFPPTNPNRIIRSLRLNCLFTPTIPKYDFTLFFEMNPVIKVECPEITHYYALGTIRRIVCY